MKKKLFVVLFACALFAASISKAHASYVGFYDEDGGNKIGYMEHVHNTVDITVDTPTKDGFIFNGWASNNQNVTFSGNTLTLPWGPGDFRNNRPIEVYATWTESYTITYVLDGGEASGNPDSYTINDTFTINDPIKNGYEFLGWINEDGENLGKGLTIEQGTTGDMVLTAAWKKNPTVVNETVVTNNPKTGDNLLFSIGLISFGLTSLVGLYLIDKKITNN